MLGSGRRVLRRTVSRKLYDIFLERFHRASVGRLPATAEPSETNQSDTWPRQQNQETNKDSDPNECDDFKPAHAMRLVRVSESVTLERAGERRYFAFRPAFDHAQNSSREISRSRMRRLKACGHRPCDG